MKYYVILKIGSIVVLLKGSIIKPRSSSDAVRVFSTLKTCSNAFQ
jgi:hypothetical protein